MSSLGENNMQFSRRDALKFGGLAAAGAAGLTLPFGRSVQASTASLLASRNFPKVYGAAFKPQGVAKPTSTGFDTQTGRPYANYDIWARESSANFLPGLSTRVLNYLQNGTPAPLIHVNRGTRIQMSMHNRMPAINPLFGSPLKISTHLHGSASLPQYDGYADDLTLSMQKKIYQYPNHQPARTLWYHDHGVHYTAKNVYSGLVAQYHLHDEAERMLLPSYANDGVDPDGINVGGVLVDQRPYDVALTVSDHIFKANGQLLYDDRSQSGLWGDVITVNGVPWPVMKVKRRVYRFRLLTATLARSFRFSLSNGAPMHMVATDGGLMPKTVPVTSFRQAGAERYEFLVDFSKFPTLKAGTRIELRNASNDNNRDYDFTHKVMAFELTDEAFDTKDPSAFKIPTTLVNSDVMNLQPTASIKRRSLRVERTNGKWVINGESWQDVVDSGYKKVVANPALGDTEIWDLQNNSGGWFHPVHIHLIDFKILSRNGRPPFAYEQGPKDVAYVGEGETVKVMMKFEPHRGKYMVHCHNLPHEDHDMMHQFSVGLKDTDLDENDPIESDPAHPDTDE